MASDGVNRLQAGVCRASGMHACVGQKGRGEAGGRWERGGGARSRCERDCVTDSSGSGCWVGGMGCNEALRNSWSNSQSTSRVLGMLATLLAKAMGLSVGRKRMVTYISVTIFGTFHLYE